MTIIPTYSPSPGSSGTSLDNRDFVNKNDQKVRFLIRNQGRGREWESSYKDFSDLILLISSHFSEVLSIVRFPDIAEEEERKYESMDHHTLGGSRRGVWT